MIGGSKERVNEVTAVGDPGCHVNTVGEDEPHPP